MDLAPLKRQHNRFDIPRCTTSGLKGLFGGGGEKAATQAGQVQTAATEEAQRIAALRFGETQAALQPFQQAALPALQQFQALLGLGGTGGTSGSGFGGGAGALSEAQIRQNLISSGQFSTSGREGFQLLHQDPLSGKQFFVDENAPSEDIRRAKLTIQKGIDNPRLVQGGGVASVEGVFNNLTDVAEGVGVAGFTTFGQGGGGLDQAALDAEVQRQLAQQGGVAGTAGQTGLEAQQQAIQSVLDSPGQQFLRQRAQQGLTRQASALGGVGGGRVREALVQQGAGFAAQDLQNQFSRLQTLIGGGQTAATNLGSFGQQQAATAGGLLQAGAQARAGGILGAQQAQAQQGSNIAGLVGAGLSFFSDENMKHDVRDMTPEECMDAVMMLDIKAWRYLPQFNLGEEMQIGPMAQQSPECIKVHGKEMLDLHSELMLIAGAMQYLMLEDKLCQH